MREAKTTIEPVSIEKSTPQTIETVLYQNQNSQVVLVNGCLQLKKKE